MKSTLILMLGLVASVSVHASTASKKVVSVVPTAGVTHMRSIATETTLPFAGMSYVSCDGFEFDFDANGTLTNTFTVTLDDKTSFDVSFPTALALGSAGAYSTQSPIQGLQSACNYQGVLAVTPNADASKIDVVLTVPAEVGGDVCSTETVDFDFHAEMIMP